ncbi:MAG: ABC transporter ATP-binding protein [Clostridia bacterium]
MSVLVVKDLGKSYENFALCDVSFALEDGKITGFIGRNGAGKSTVLKSMLNFVHPDKGEVFFFGERYRENEQAIKQEIGFVAGGIDYYPKKKLRAITETTKRFYARWDDDAYARYLALFHLDERKTPDQLSEGMKVKYALALALSHRARLLILDEPTSGLDPVSREELLDIFLSLAEKGLTILFSTHITSDLETCADNILYLKEGRLLACDDLARFVNGYRLVTFAGDTIPDAIQSRLIGLKKTKGGHSALIKSPDCAEFCAERADLASIMIHLEQEDARP